MPRIYVEFSRLDQIGSRCKSVASKVDAIFFILFYYEVMVINAKRYVRS